jgi:hypothetical protein
MIPRTAIAAAVLAAGGIAAVVAPAPAGAEPLPLVCLDGLSATYVPAPGAQPITVPECWDKPAPSPGKAPTKPAARAPRWRAELYRERAPWRPGPASSSTRSTSSGTRTSTTARTTSSGGSGRRCHPLRVERRGGTETREVCF